MPVILDPRDFDFWLGVKPYPDLQEILRPYPANQLVASPVNSQVNNARVDNPMCLAPAPAAPPPANEISLFPED
jgi:putative SOS response-associated peptidase YedK